MSTTIEASYILPIRHERPEENAELAEYLRRLSRSLEIVVVDGSSPDVFAAHAERWGGFVRHIRPDPDLITPMGKVGGVLTGVRHASCERLLIADDDVRYEPASILRVAALLDTADVVRPQNYFDPLPWHARWDTARILLNRMTGGDWPGTLGVRRSTLVATGGYDGSVMFENLELVRTVRAAGGTETVALDVFVRRSPPSGRHFWSQRVRQAYDELARPARLAVWLAVLPLAGWLVATRRRAGLVAAAGAAIGLAECGRWRAGGRVVFPFTASLLAPLWVAERGLCAWLAVGARVLVGGVPYRGSILRRAATPERELKRRHGTARASWVRGRATVYRNASSERPVRTANHRSLTVTQS